MASKHRLLLAIDAVVNLALGAILLGFPAGLIDLLGLPPTSTYFYASILGAVIFGIGVALVLELYGAPRGIRGLGLGGAIAINLCGGGALTIWLLIVPLDVPVRGMVILWTVAVVVVDPRPGVMYLALIHHALAQTSLAAAVNAITLSRRMSGHNYYLAGADGEIVDVETTATQAEVITPAGGFYAHANHYLTPALIGLEAEGPNRSTLQRLNRMNRLLHDLAGEATPSSLMQTMADQQGGRDGAICRPTPATRLARAPQRS